jgi:hypothetical protein
MDRLFGFRSATCLIPCREEFSDSVVPWDHHGFRHPRLSRPIVLQKISVIIGNHREAYMLIDPTIGRVQGDQIRYVGSA